MPLFSPCLLTKIKSKRNASRGGTVTLEFALLAAPFFLLMMGVIELCLMLGAQQLLESAAYNTSRLAKTGYSASGQTQSQTVSQLLTNLLSSYGALIDTSKVTVTETSYSSFAASSVGGGTTGYGTQQQIVVYTVSYAWPLFTPMMCTAFGSACKTGNVVNLTSMIVVRNEPYG